MLAIVFQDKKTSDEFYGIYFEMLKDLPEEVIIPAIKDCLCLCRFFPTIAEIREKAKPYQDAINFQKRLKESENNEAMRKREDDEKRKISELHHEARIKELEEKKEKGRASRQEIELLGILQYGKTNIGVKAGINKCGSV